MHKYILQVFDRYKFDIMWQSLYLITVSISIYNMEIKLSETLVLYSSMAMLALFFGKSILDDEVIRCLTEYFKKVKREEENGKE